MTDCIDTLHCIMRSPDELAAARADIGMAWSASLVIEPIADHEPGGGECLVVTGAAAQRHDCPRIQEIIFITEEDWSKKCLEN